MYKNNSTVFMLINVSDGQRRGEGGEEGGGVEIIWATRKCAETMRIINICKRALW